jgi:hypothetical protein
MNPITKIFWNENERRVRALWRIVAQFMLWLAISIILFLPILH